MAHHILHVFGAMDRGGAEVRTVSLLRYMDTERFDVDFWAISGCSGDLDNEIRMLGGRVLYARKGWRRWLSLFEELKAGNYDAVHSNVCYASGFVLALAAFARVPLRIAHFRTTQDGKGVGVCRIIYRALMRILLGHYSTALVAVSKGVMDAMWGPRWRTEPRCHVIYGGVECSADLAPRDRTGVLHEFGLPEASAVVIHVGRMGPVKNHERVLSIFEHLLLCDKHYVLLFVGKQDALVLAHLKKRSASLGVSQRVVFAGIRTDVPRLLAAADVMIFPSLWEGLPGVVLEAVAAGTPVLSSDLPGALEIAEYSHLVKCLPLEVSDAIWATTAHDMANISRQYQQPVSSLSGTPFDIRIVARHVEDLYSGGCKSRSPSAGERVV